LISSSSLITGLAGRIEWQELTSSGAAKKDSYEQSIIGTDFPKAKTAAKTLGVSRARADHSLAGWIGSLREKLTASQKRIVRKKKK
jgi:hypothetical protein